MIYMGRKELAAVNKKKMKRKKTDEITRLRKNHPKVMCFLDELLEEGIQEGTIIGITIKKPEKERKYTNFRVTKEDLEWLSKIKKLLFFCKRLKLKRVRILK